MTDSFFDTSALVKRYATEPGTETVDDLIDADETTVFITSLSVVEMTSAFRRKYNRGDVAEETMIGLVSAFFDEALAEFVILPMDEALFNWSFDLILDDDLRTLDSLQLAAALALSADRSDFRWADGVRGVRHKNLTRIDGGDTAGLPVVLRYGRSIAQVLSRCR